MTIARIALAGLCLTLSLAACNRSYIEGRVTNMRGEALPGVIVLPAGTSAQDLTDALGRYRVPAPQGTVRLQFSKSGYTPAEVVINASKRGPIPDAILWILPMNPGVYLVSDLNYIEVPRVIPKQYYLKDGSAAYGAELPKEMIETAEHDPFIVTNRTPRYNARITHMVAAEVAQQGDTASSTAEVWVESGTMAAALDPVDAPAGQLLRVRAGRPLEPGVYGVHWGAMEGYTTIDNRVFLFRVTEPPATEAAPGEAVETVAPATPAEEKPAEDADAKKDSKKEKGKETPKEPTKDPTKEPEKKPAAAPPAKTEPQLLEPADDSAAPPARP